MNKKFNLNALFYLSKINIINRYRNSFLGPIWITLSTALFILTITYISNFISSIDLNNKIYYIGSGYILWTFIQYTISKSIYVFQENETLIKEFSLPLIFYLYKLMMISTIIFFHNFILIVAIILITKNYNFNLLYFVITFLLLFFNTFFISIITAILSSKYTDIKPIVENGLFILFVITPIIWPSSLIQENFIMNINIVFHMIESVRYALINGELKLDSIIILIESLAVFGLISSILYQKNKRKLIFYI